VAFGGCGLIRGVAFGGCGIIRGVAFGGCCLIRGVAFGGCGLIRGLAFGECGLIRGVLQYSKSPSHIKQNYEKLEIAIVKPVFTEPDLEINFCPQNRHVFGLYRLN
jgi:hypothetical protein